MEERVFERTGWGSSFDIRPLLPPTNLLQSRTTPARTPFDTSSLSRDLIASRKLRFSFFFCSFSFRFYRSSRPARRHKQICYVCGDNKVTAGATAVVYTGIYQVTVSYIMRRQWPINLSAAESLAHQRGDDGRVAY